MLSSQHNAMKLTEKEVRIIKQNFGMKKVLFVSKSSRLKKVIRGAKILDIVLHYFHRITSTINHFRSIL